VSEPWTEARVHEAASAAIWVPPDAPQVVTADYLLVDFPPGYDDEQPTQVQWTRSDRAAADLVDEVVAQARAWGRSRLAWWVRLDHRPPELPDLLLDRGATTVETVGVLARPIDTSLPDAPPPEEGRGLRVEVVRDEQTLRDARLVYAEVWGRSPDPTPEQQERDLAEAATPVGERPTFQVVAYLGGEPAAAGGCTRSGEVARLWGAATRPHLRGRGAYRATVRTRLELAREHGATLGLVRGRLHTSAPVLTRLGFASYGEEPLLVLEI
jgi:GNAT superfamily N-acetyltransferase